MTSLDELRRQVHELVSKFDLAYNEDAIVRELVDTYDLLGESPRDHFDSIPRRALSDLFSKHAYPQDSPQSREKRSWRTSIQNPQAWSR